MAASTSWRGAPFFIEKHEVHESNLEKEARVLGAVKRVASQAVLCSSFLFLVAMVQASSWLVAKQNKHYDAEVFLGPAGIHVDDSKIAFWNCPVPFELPAGTRAWMQFYGVCAGSPDAPTLWWWTLMFGWTAVLLTAVAPAIGLLKVLVRVEAVIALVGEMCALSTLICFLNWNYVSDLMFEQAIIFQLDGNGHIAMGEPRRMTFNWPIVCFLMGLFTCFFALISLMVVARSGFRDHFVALTSKTG